MRRTAIALIPFLAAAADAPIEVGVELQLWHPHDPLPAYAGQNQQGRTGAAQSSFGYELAPAITAAYGLAPGERLRLTGWYAHDEASGRATDTGAGSGVVPVFILPTSTPADLVRDRDEYTAWSVDLACERDAAVDGWALTPSIGLRYLDLATRQKLTVTAGGVTSHDDDRVASWALGPRVALGAGRALGHGWSAFVDGGFALMTARVDERGTATSGNTVHFDQGEARTATTLDAALGVAWAFAPAWSVDLSYAIGVWRDVLPDERQTVVGTTGGRDLSWDAVALGATWRNRR